MADGVRLVLDDLARHGSAVRGQRGDERDQLERDARRALRRHRLRPLPGFAGERGRRRRWRSAARRRTGHARAGGPSGDGWRTRRPPECRAGPGHRRAGSARNHGCRDRPGSTRPRRAPRWNWSRPTRSAGPRRRRPPESASVHPVMRGDRRMDRLAHLHSNRSFTVQPRLRVLRLRSAAEVIGGRLTRDRGYVSERFSGYANSWSGLGCLGSYRPISPAPGILKCAIRPQPSSSIEDTNSTPLRSSSATVCSMS